jgi:formate dehydrogenase subunit delta
MSNTEKLTRMVNSIGDFFGSSFDREDAIDHIALHLRLFWHRGLHEQIIAQLDREEDSLDELAREAIRRLIEPTGNKRRENPDGNPR